MRAPVQFALIAGLALASAGATFLLKGRPPQEAAHQCDRARLKPDEVCLDQISGKVLWIDARSRAEWKRNGVEGSILWNLEAGEDAALFEAEAAARLFDAEQVVVYCGSEACGTSREIARMVNALGLGPEAKVLHGGWLALRDAGRVPR